MNAEKHKNIMIFAGTTEGRVLAQYMEKKKIPCYVSTATEYGCRILDGLVSAERMYGRMNEDQMRVFFTEKEIGFVIDATHPYALEVTENIKHACKVSGVSYVRCLRERSRVEKNEQFVYVNSVREAVEFLNTVSGNIFLATGSKELEQYTSVYGWKERCYARVLSSKESVIKAIETGFEGSHLIAMQGPFSAELNTAMLRQTRSSYFVTKESGKAGGFEEKIKAAKAAGAVPVIIVRPDEKGRSINDVKRMIDELQSNCQPSRAVLE